MQDEDVYTYFDPELPFERDNFCSSGKMGQGLDRRLAAKSSDRLIAKSNKMGVVRTKTYPPTSPDHNISHARSNSFKDRKFTEHDALDDSVMNISAETYFSCAVGRKRSAARFSLPSSEEVVLLFKELAATYPDAPAVKDAKEDSGHSSSIDVGIHVLQAAGEMVHP